MPLSCKKFVGISQTAIYKNFSLYLQAIKFLLWKFYYYSISTLTFEISSETKINMQSNLRIKQGVYPDDFRAFDSYSILIYFAKVMQSNVGTRIEE